MVDGSPWERARMYRIYGRAVTGVCLTPAVRPRDEDRGPEWRR